LLIFFAVYTLPKLEAFQLKSQARQIIDLAAEEEVLCAKLAMGKGTPAHDQCLPAVQDFRARVEKELLHEPNKK
jgi:hypothetical protein